MVYSLKSLSQQVLNSMIPNLIMITVSLTMLNWEYSNLSISQTTINHKSSRIRRLINLALDSTTTISNSWSRNKDLLNSSVVISKEFTIMVRLYRETTMDTLNTRKSSENKNSLNITNTSQLLQMKTQDQVLVTLKWHLVMMNLLLIKSNLSLSKKPSLWEIKVASREPMIMKKTQIFALLRLNEPPIIKCI